MDGNYELVLSPFLKTLYFSLSGTNPFTKLGLISYSTRLPQKQKELDYYQSPRKVLRIGFMLFQSLLLAYIWTPCKYT